MPFNPLESGKKIYFSLFSNTTLEYPLLYLNKWKAMIKCTLVRKHIFILFFVLINIILPHKTYSTVFDELDKPPEGAHKGQMFLGAFVYFGLPRGDIIKAENDFLKSGIGENFEDYPVGSTYTFSNGVTRAIEVSHYSMGTGISFEYMPIDYLGVYSGLRRSYIIQKSNFGSNYENWMDYLYRDIAIYQGISLHATNRKRWDFVLIPFIGYSFSKFIATSVARKTINQYIGNTRKSSQGLLFGSQLNCTIYFSGGLYTSIGAEWIKNRLDFGNGFYLINPQTGRIYLYGKNSGNIDSFSIIISAGYSFSN